MSSERELNLNIGINTTGYLPGAWKYRTGSRYDVVDPTYYLRLTQLAHRGLFDAVFLSDMSALAMEPGRRHGAAVCAARQRHPQVHPLHARPVSVID